MKYRTGFIGGGAMAGAIIGGLLSSGCLNQSEILVSTPTRASRLEEYDVDKTSDNALVISDCGIVFVACKPKDVDAVLSSLVSNRQSLFAEPEQVLVSLCAGKTLRQLKVNETDRTPIIRIMPNIPVHSKAGAFPYCCNEWVGDGHLAELSRMLSQIGVMIPVTEANLNAATSISGCGPAYMAQAVEALADAGVQHGLPRPAAYQLATATLLGSGKYLHERPEMHPACLKDAVCSPGGATIEGVIALEKSGFRASLMAAVTATMHKLELMDMDSEK